MQTLKMAPRRRLCESTEDEAPLREEQSLYQEAPETPTDLEPAAPVCDPAIAACSASVSAMRKAPQGPAAEAPGRMLEAALKGMCESSPNEDACARSTRALGHMPQSEVSTHVAAAMGAAIEAGKFETRNSTIGNFWLKEVKNNPKLKADYAATKGNRLAQEKFRQNWLKQSWNAVQASRHFNDNLRNCETILNLRLYKYLNICLI